MNRKLVNSATIAVLSLPISGAALASTPSIIAPWQPLSGSYTGTLYDGRLLAYPPPDPAYASFFFTLVENAILTMTGDMDGWARSAVATDPAAASPPHLGDFWEHSNGGRGFTSSFCGGYTDGGCGVGFGTNSLGVVLGGPPSIMDNGFSDYSPVDVATTGWPAALSGLAQFLLRLGNPQMCIAPPGAPEAQLHSCASGLTFRNGNSALFVSPDAGSQWYPLSSSCGIPWAIGLDLVATDAGQPGHVVGFKRDNGDGHDASGCALVNACSERLIAWTGDVSLQVAATISATATLAASQTAPYDVDHAGLPGSDDPIVNPEGWRYAALGHLALDVPGKTCDVGHAGIQPNCHASTNDKCHTQKPPSGAGASTPPHERFCPATTQPECSCGYVDGSKVLHPFTESNCAFPEVTSLAIDPRNGQVYAPSAVPDANGDLTIPTGLLFSPDGGRKWRRSGHGSFVKYGTAPVPNAGPSESGFGSTEEPFPYDDADPYDTNPATPPDGVNDPGVRILTLQGVGSAGCPFCSSSTLGDSLAFNLNAQPSLMQHLGRVSFASSPCQTAPPPGETAQFKDPMGFLRDRIQVTAVIAATWHNPLTPTQLLSGVFVAHGDSCSDAAAHQPLVFRDTANLMPDGVVNPLGWTGYFATGALLAATPHWSVDEQPKSIQGTTTVKLPLIGDAKGPAS